MINPIEWMVRNRIAPNLLMVLLIFGGLLLTSQIKQEVFPAFDLDLISVTVPYRGAGPEEVELGVVLAIEDAVRGVDGVKKVRSSSVEGAATVLVEVSHSASSDKVLQDVKNRVDGIQTFPKLSDRPLIQLMEAKNEVVSLMVYGDVNFQLLHECAEKIREDLLRLKEITQVEISGVPPMEIGVDISQFELLKYHLTLDQVARTIQKTALEVPVGSVKTSSGEVLLRTDEKRSIAKEFQDIPIITKEDGTQIHLGELATVLEGYEDTDERSFFNGDRSIRLNIFRVGSQTPTSVSSAVSRYIQDSRATLPKGISLATWADHSEMYQQRLDLLLKNSIQGLLLVLLLLALFLDPRLAFWVTMGIPVSVIGCFLFLPMLGVSINMISLFAFLITLGIVVDDAIVVGENIFSKREKMQSCEEAAICGAKEISSPVIFAVLTNMVAFLPLFFIPGSTGKFFWQIPSIVILVFAISLFESLFILPSHLAHEYRTDGIWHFLTKPTKWFNFYLNRFIQTIYLPQLKLALKWRYLTLSIGIAGLIVAVSCVIGGRIQFSYLPKIDSDLITAQIKMPFGISEEVSKEVKDRLVAAANAIFEENGGDRISRGIYTQIGTPIIDFGPNIGGGNFERGTHIIGAQVFLVSADQRKISGDEFARKWREKTGDIAGVDSVKFTGTFGIAGSEGIQLDLSHPSADALEKAATKLANQLKSYVGITDVSDGVLQGKQQLSFRLTPSVRSLGVTVNDLANQVRSAFYGSEAIRQQRGRSEVKVMVRLPENERKSIHTLENFFVRTPFGGEMPLTESVEVVPGKSYSIIRRQDGRRTLTVNAAVDGQKANTNRVVSDVMANLIPDLMQEFPGLSYSFSGEQQEQSDSITALSVGFILVLALIYALLAIPFKSYVQPIIIMLSIPFGVIGAVLGHLILGFEISIISMFGIIALAGVVINDSLVFVVMANEIQEAGIDCPTKALLKTGGARFRPIILTSLTTFFGLIPMIFETSMQARFLIPMAISLGFGVMFATVITLLLIPALYLIFEDIKFVFRYKMQSLTIFQNLVNLS